MYATHETGPIETAPSLVLVEDVPEMHEQADNLELATRSHEETNRELLAYLGEKTVAEWYQENGLGYAVPASTHEVASSLAEHWVVMGGTVMRGESIIDGSGIYGDSIFDSPEY